MKDFDALRATGWTSRRLAAALGINPRRAQEWLSGKRNPPPTLAAAIAALARGGSQAEPGRRLLRDGSPRPSGFDSDDTRLRPATTAPRWYRIEYTAHSGAIASVIRPLSG